MVHLLIFLLFWIQSLAESPTEKLDTFFLNKRNEAKEKNRNFRAKIPSKPSKKQYILFKPKKYQMNMQDSVETRWGPLCHEYTTNYTIVYNYLHDAIESTGTGLIVYGMAMDWFYKYVTDPYKSEMEYFADCTKVPLKGVVLMNLMEMFLLLGCTAVVCADTNNELIFGKNLDLWMLDIQDPLRSVIITVEYTNGKDILFTGDSFFGYSGVISGVKPNGYGVGVNARYTDDTIFDCLSALKNNGNLPYSWLIRDTLSGYDKYEDAVKEFETTPIATPCYYVVGGTKYPDGVVITRNFTDSIKPFELETSYLDWYILQTNDDWWKDPTDERRKDGITNMELMGQRHASEKHLLSDVLSRFETINFGTISQTMIIPLGSDSSSSDSSSSDSSDSDESDEKKFGETYVVKFQVDETYVRVDSAQIEMINGDDFIDSFERMWNKYVGIGIAIFAASIFFNVFMCIYWSAGYKSYTENKDKETKVIISESESDETESCERDDDDF